MRNRKALQRTLVQAIEVLEDRRMLAASYAPMVGSPYEAYSASTGSQFDADIDYQGGRGVITWTDMNAPGGSGADVMARLIDDSGSFAGPAFRVNTAIANDQVVSKVGVAADGSFVIGWWDNSDTAIKFQRYDTYGAAAGSVITFSNTDLVNMGDIAVAADGSFIVAYERWMLGLDVQAAFQRFDANGVTVGGITEANTTLVGNQQNPSVAINSAGGFVITWSGQGLADLLGGVFMQRYDASANPIGGETLVNTTTTGSQAEPRIVALSDDSMVVTWIGEGAGDSEGIFFQRFDSTGVVLGGETLVNVATIGSQRYPVISANADDRFAIGWNDLNSGQTVVRLFNADGSGYSEELRSAAGAVNQPVTVGITDASHASITYSDGSHVFLASFQPGLLIRGTAGDDEITLEDDSGGLSVTVNGATTNHSDVSNGVTITGSDGNDTITIMSLPAGLGGVTVNGDDGADSIVGSAGADEVFGGEGDDTMDGGLGSDTLLGEIGEDLLRGGTGDDSLSGGKGVDTIDGGLGADVISGGDGIDTATYESRTLAVSVRLDGVANDGVHGEGDNVDESSEILVGGSGNDTLDGTDALVSMTLRGNGGADLLTGGAFNDSLDGGAGIDTLDGGLGADHLRGGGNSDTVTYASRSASVSVLLNSSDDDGEANEDDNVQSDIEIVVGGSGNDTLAASGSGHSLFGGAGDDSLVGAAGNDSLVGGAGMDFLRGNSGNDMLVGDAERDRLIGGVGSDTMEGGEGPDLLYGQSGNDSIFGGVGRDQVWGGEGDDRVKGEHHDDTVYGEVGNDRIYGDHGNDLIDGGENDNYLQGGVGNDLLFGGTGYDKLFGELGNDTINGGSGHDRIDGGEGSDSSILDLLDKLFGMETRL